MTQSVVRQRLVQAGSRMVRTASAFPGALFAIGLWGLSGIILHFSDGWQRVTMTGTAIAAFLMVLDVRRTLGREIEAVRLQLDQAAHAATNAARQSRKLPPPLPKFVAEPASGYGQAHDRLPPPPPPLRRGSASSSVTPPRLDRRTA